LCRALHRALPNAPPPKQQVIQDAAILHTTLARLIKPPRSGRRLRTAGRVLRWVLQADEVHALQAAVRRMSAALCGLRVTLPVLW
jgi:hypothetical protein